MRLIKLVGLGPGSPHQVPDLNIEALRTSKKSFLRTSSHPSVALLREKGISFETFDALYEECPTFEEVYRGICDSLISEVGKHGVVAYAVPGHPFFGEATVGMVNDAAERVGIRCEVFPAMSFLDAVCAVLKVDPVEGLEIVDACAIDRRPPGGARDVVVSQVYNERLTSDVKLALMTRYPPEHRVALVTAAGVPGEERVIWLPIYELDRQRVNHLTSLFVPRIEAGRGAEERPSRWPLDPLVGVVERLRGEEGCPWDREQTHESLRQYVIEEAYEVVEAIDLGDMNKLCDELGDLLLQVVLHSRIAQESGHFDVQRVVDGITRKMVRRHVHVFGGKRAKTSGEVIDRWESIKRDERNGECPLVRSPGAFPALMRAYHVQRAAAGVGFDWKDVQGVLSKIEEEIAELREAVGSGKPGEVEEEIGDILFSVVNACRFVGVNPEVALGATVRKFVERFAYIEAAASRLGKDLSEMSMDEMDALWEQSKG
ncbi:MAG: nucleoside triphosphate pyrophosphohydrolase [Firmicutes bacterium]|jgi:tetrapyrrole methylase family protein/MazG family protein|nr:nucleoside triphosphate pyrophosphohydrolase [Bacillota bacterium]